MNFKLIALMALIMIVIMSPVQGAFWTNSTFIAGNAYTFPNGTSFGGSFVPYGWQTQYWGAIGVTAPLVACSNQGTGYITGIAGWNVAHQNNTYKMDNGFPAWDVYCDNGNATYWVIMQNDGQSATYPVNPWKGPIVASWYIGNSAPLPYPNFTADFTWTPNTPGFTLPQIVLFNDTSTGAKVDSWSWDLVKNGTGSVMSSNNPYATYEFTQAGTYTMTLIVTNGSQQANKSRSYFTSSTNFSYPVTIVDSTTDAAIAGSELDSTGSPTAWYNQTSLDGKFQINGKGVNGTQPMIDGESMIFQGKATGYVTNGIAIAVNQNNNGKTQYVPLAPESIRPIAGQFTAVISTYDTSSTAAVSNVLLIVSSGSVNTSKSTNPSGTATFTNLTAGNSYSVTATKTGYSTITKIFTGGTGTIVTVSVPMSPSAVNPTPTSTGTPVPTRTYPGQTIIPTPSGTPAYQGNGTFWDEPKQTLIFMGADPTTIGIVLAFLLIFVCAVLGGASASIVGWSGGGDFNFVGAEAGAIFGMVASIAFGFFPLYLAIVLGLILIVYVPLRLFGGR